MHPHYRLTFILCLVLPGLTYAQQAMRDYVQKNATSITTVSPASTNYDDLTAFGNAIGDARIVMLGEQDHGDATAFQAKTRLVKYLHEKKGFNILAFESDFGLNVGWGPTPQKPENTDSLINRYITYVWSLCDACQLLFKQYIPATQSTPYPLILAGIDCDMRPGDAASTLISLIDSLGLQLTTRPDYHSVTLPSLKCWMQHLNDNDNNTRILKTLDTIKTQLQAILPPADPRLQVIDNMVAMDSVFRNANTQAKYWLQTNARDAQMAANIKWLATQRYPHEKIIVWAHNVHVSKYAGHYPDKDYFNDDHTMGTVLTSDPGLNTQTYIVGFTSAEGSSGWVNRKGPPYTLPKLSSNGFEHWIPANMDYAFVDFRAFNRTNPQWQETFNLAGGTNSPAWRHKDIEGPWNKIFDGVFFIRKMTPCDAVNMGSH